VTALLFDLDGTLTDPRPGIGPSLRGTFATLLETSDRASLRARVPLRPTLRARADGRSDDKAELLAYLLAVEKIASANAVMIVATSGAP
jgi:phosphoglycolate phosphatase-like HAD superfamily hydrolase